MNGLQALITGITTLFLVLTTTTQQITPAPVQPTLPQQNSLPAATESSMSRNWAGYTATHGTYAGVSGRWTIPTITNTDNPGADATWVGVGGVDTQDLIQAGTQATVDSSGHVYYSTFYETLPSPSQQLSLTVHPGDSISVSLKKRDNNMWDISLKNKTTGESTSLSTPYNSSLSSAEWIEEAPTGLRRELPLDDFGSVSITNATAIQNGNMVSLAQTHAKAISMTGRDDTTLAQASIVADDGGSFTVMRTNQEISNDSGTIPIVEVIGRSFPYGLRRHILRFFYE